MRGDESNLRGLPPEDGKRSVEDYFAMFRWEPELMDPASLTASEHLGMLGAEDGNAFRP